MNLWAEDTGAQADLGYGGPRAGGDTFGSAIARIERAVVESCDERAEWPARIAAGINSATDFMVANPAAARALAVQSRSGEDAGDAGYVEMIGRFAGLLGAGAPRPERLPASSDEAIVTLIAAIFSCHVRAGTVDALSSRDPDLVFLALLPYVGFAEASRRSADLSR
jgi:hypothetical protein